VLARRAGDIAIFDTGMAHNAPTLTAALAAEGVAPADVTLIFNTHAHVDHSHNNALFPNARIHCSRLDREWTQAFHRVLDRSATPGADDIAPFYPELVGGDRSRKLIRKVVGIEKMLWREDAWGPDNRCAWLEDEPLPEGITMLPTPGHSPYHVSFIIQTADLPVLVCGDALLLRDEADYSAPMMPPWSIAMYRESQARIRGFTGVIVPGHDEPFENDPQKRRSNPPVK
jgi:glyoxylase-like metal-dependent hydrolase (beta-lactamase superfamily II)